MIGLAFMKRGVGFFIAVNKKGLLENLRKSFIFLVARSAGFEPATP